MILCATARAEEPSPISAVEFRDLHKQLFDEADSQLWRKIPWTASVRDALAQAEKQGKPILRWESHGPPLTCG
jgi:hypothetical protein